MVCLDLSILAYHFMQNALLAGLLGGIGCSIVGVFVVMTGLAFIGTAIAHAAFAGALCGAWLGFNPLVGAFGFSLGAAGIIGPLADKGEFRPDTAIGIIFSATMGLAFLFMGLMPGPKTEGLEILWGSILAVNDTDLWVLIWTTAAVLGVTMLFFKEFQAVMFQREVALAVGIPANAIFYLMLFLTGAVVAACLRSIGGLLVFNLILNPAAAAYQLTYDLRRMYVLAAAFGVLSAWAGLWLSYLFNLPSGATIVLVTTAVFATATPLSPKRRVKKWTKETPREDS